VKTSDVSDQSCRAQATSVTLHHRKGLGVDWNFSKPSSSARPTDRGSAGI
jgi:hypothetical protein